jgi:hypothetical protein
MKKHLIFLNTITILFFMLIMGCGLIPGTDKMDAINKKRDRDYQTYLLGRAIVNCDLEEIKLALSKGADVNGEMVDEGGDEDKKATVLTLLFDYNLEHGLLNLTYLPVFAHSNNVYNAKSLKGLFVKELQRQDHLFKIN